MLERPLIPRTLATVLLALALARPGLAEPPQAPFGDQVSAAITYYNRASPHIATAGLLAEGGIAEARDLGFTAIVDLRGPEEGTDATQAAAAATGLAYINIPVTTKAPTEAQVSVFGATVDSSDNWPVLVICKSANRAGAMWALYRVARGVPAEVAIEEGRTAGLKPSREGAVRAQLGLKPLQN